MGVDIDLRLPIVYYDQEEERKMKEKSSLEVVQRRSYKVVKANEIIQKARYDLSLQELKALSYCISLIKPNDTIDREYSFSIYEYCEVCGIQYASGKNFSAIKESLKSLRDKSFWIGLPDGSITTVGWLAKATINQGSGKVKIKFDPTLQEYIFGLFENFTQYELLSTLPMQSAYSFRIYELLKSYAFTRSHTFEIGELKKHLAAERYSNFKDFRINVIERAVKEINLYTDIEISWEPIYRGRKVISVTFYIKQRDAWGRIAAEKRANDQIDGQMSLFDLPDPEEGD